MNSKDPIVLYVFFVRYWNVWLYLEYYCNCKKEIKHASVSNKTFKVTYEMRELE